MPIISTVNVFDAVLVVTLDIVTPGPSSTMTGASRFSCGGRGSVMFISVIVP